MTTATIDRPHTKRGSKSTNPDGNGAAHTPAPGDDLNELRAQLAKQETATQSMYGDKLDKATARLTELRNRVAAGEVRALPLPAPASLTFEERDVAIATIVVTGNHREIHDEAETLRLARTLQTVGLQQRIGLRSQGDGSFELIFGSRRLAAAKLNAWEEIPAKVYPHTITAAEVEIIRTIENFGRKDLTHIERAIAVARTIDAIQATLDKGRRHGGHGGMDVVDLRTEEQKAELRRQVNLAAVAKENPELADAIKLQIAIDDAGGVNAYVGLQLGFPAKWVQDHAYVSKLGAKARELLAAHRIDIGHARELVKLGDRDRADQIADMVARDEKGLGGKSIEQCRNWVIEHLRSLKIVPWRLDVAFGRGVAGCTGHACSTCPFNSKSDPDLFGGAIADEPAAGTCTNEACWQAKTDIVAKDVGKFVAKARTAVEKHDTPITEKELGKLIPLHVKPPTAIRKAKKELEPAASASGEGTPDSRETGGTPEDKANGKLNVALGKWESELTKLVIAQTTEHPVRFALLALLGCVPPFDRGYFPGDQPAEFVSEHQHALALAGGGIGEIQELASLAIEAKAEPPVLDGITGEICAFLLQKWGIKHNAMPKLEDFLTRPKAEGKKGAGKLKGEPAAELGVAFAAAQKACVLETLSNHRGNKPVAATPLELNDRLWVHVGASYKDALCTVDLLPLYHVEDFRNKFGAKFETRYTVGLGPDATDSERREFYTGVIVRVKKTEMAIAPSGEGRTLLFTDTTSEAGEVDDVE